MVDRFSLIAAGMFALAPVVAAGQGHSSLADRRLPTAGPFGEFTLQSPLGNDDCRVAVIRMAQLAKVALGFEAIPEEPLPPHAQRRRPEVAKGIALNGFTVGEALNAIMRENGHYSWSERNGVFNVAAPGSETDPANFLNRPVTDVRWSNVNVVGALDAIHRRFDASYTPTITVNTGPPSSAESREEESRVFSVSMARGTLRDLLNAIVLAHGSAYWLVDYSGATRTFPDSRLALCGFAGQCVVWSAR